MLTAHHISKSYNINKILEDISFSINLGEKAGLIGPNGSGKTTLLKILTGQLKPDSGTITYNPPDIEIGYLSQGFDPPQSLTIRKMVKNQFGDPEYLSRKITSLAQALSQDPQDKNIQASYDEALQKLESYQPPTLQPEKMFSQFGLSDISQDELVSNLSGGQKTRLRLALLLISEPEILILDEPTNHLDIKMLKWIEAWIKNFAGGVLIVSHDRTFLDNTVDRIIDLNPATHTIRVYQGSYSDYLEQYLAELEKQMSKYKDQVAEIQRIEGDINSTKRQAYQVEITTTSREPGPRRYAKKVARKAKSREKKLERFLNSDERIDKPKQSWQMKLEFPKKEHQSQDILSIENLAIGYNQVPIISDINLYVKNGARIALTGPNGAGKTTLLRTIGGYLSPIAGKVKLGPSIQLGYMSQEQDTIEGGTSVLNTIQSQISISETDARSFLHYFLFTGEAALRLVADLSYGERARLALASLVIQGCDFLLLDEPINHLDIPSRSRFEQALTQFDGTVLAVVHDRYFIKHYATELWTLDENGIQQDSPF